MTREFFSTKKRTGPGSSTLFMFLYLYFGGRVRAVFYIYMDVSRVDSSTRRT